MIYCHNCKSTSEYTGPFCPSCKARFVLSEKEIENRISILKSAIDAKAHEVAVECYHILADCGITDAEREYAKILERGKYAEKNLDLAEEYYGRAARKNDKEAAYRYSRLAGRASTEAGRFWLIYSSILGYENSFADTAEEFSRLGLEEDAHYFFSLAAELGSAENVVAMAERYYNGTGTERSEAHARWYMDKLALPPMYAIKLAYRLRRVPPKEPPRPILKNYDALLSSLAGEAKERGYTEALTLLSKTRAERGAADAFSDLAELKLQAGGEENVSEAIRLFEKAGSLGYAKAYLSLSDVWLSGRHTKADSERAMSALKSAGDCGASEGYKLLADIYLNGEITEKNVREALKYYEAAAALQNSEAKEKISEIKQEREKFYSDAKKAERYGTYDEAFSLAAISCDMGYLPAALMLGDLYARGYGVKVDRKNAFLWYKYAAENGLADALYPLALCYATGFGTRLDFELAKKTFILSEKAGVKEARKKIVALMERKLKKAADRLYSCAMRQIYQRKFSVAVDFLNTAKDAAHHSKAIYTLGCFYEFGIFLPCDKELAFSLYEQAYALGFRDPRANYKLKVLKMIR